MQTINNGETGLSVRNKLNTNFAEIINIDGSVKFQNGSAINSPVIVGNLIIGNGGKLITTIGAQPEHPDAAGIWKGKNNTIIGMEAGKSHTSGSWNTFIGYNAGFADDGGDQNTFIGSQCGWANTSGYHNTFIGCGAGQQQVAGHYNVYIGTDCGLADNGGNENTVIGTSAGAGSGSRNVIFGVSAGNRYNMASDNVFIGNGAGQSNTTGGNVFIGKDAGLLNTTGYENTFVGFASGNRCITMHRNTFMGFGAGQNTNGPMNTCYGYRALFNNLIGGLNVAVGVTALLNAKGDDNTAIGMGAGSLLTTGHECTFVGTGADVLAGQEGVVNSTAIGWNSQITKSHQVVIGGSLVTEVCFGSATGAAKIVCSKPKFTAIPTVITGLSSGDVWSNAGVLTIIP